MNLYSEQDVISKIIVPYLKDNLGYDELDPVKQVIFRFNHPIQVHQGRERKTIFADIVVFVRDVPIIVIDGKNPRNILTADDREQVISYARLIGDIAPYSALCNGRWQIFDSVTKQELPALPSYEELLKDQQRRRVTQRQRESLVIQATRTLFAVDSLRELSRLMKRCHAVIRNLRGYDPTKAFDELSKLLFCKMYEEREVAEGHSMRNRFTMEVVQEMRQAGVEIIETIWQNTINSDRYREVFSDQDTIGGINLPSEAIDKIVTLLEDKSLTMTDMDVKGVAFEEFLASTYRGGGLGQYFTPREVVRFMVDLADPAIGERIIDPACGTGGFLIRAYEVVSDKINNSEISARDKERHLMQLANESLIGIDWEERAARTCKMNMIIHGDGHAGVYQGNTLDINEINNKVAERRRVYQSAPEINEGSFDIVLTNPPFGAKDSIGSILSQYELGYGRRSQKREVLILERCIRLLRPGGRMLAVIPEGILSNRSDRWIRNFITQHCILKAIIRLPQDAFKMSEGASCTSIIYLIKKDPEQEGLMEQGDIFFARAEYIGISPSGKPIEQNDLLYIRDHFQLFEQGQWEGIEMQELEEDEMKIIKDPERPNGLWLEPEVNRTSLLYDRLSYVVRQPRLNNRFSYTYYHPAYFRVMKAIEELSVDVYSLQLLCLDDHPPVRGRKPAEEALEGIPIIKLRNVTRDGINTDTDFALETEDVWNQCSQGIVQKGDILITSTGEGTIGRVVIYPYDDPAIADNHVTICRLKPGINTQYVAEFLASEYGQIQMLRHISGSTGQTELLVEYIRSLQVPLPSPEIQEKIVAEMEKVRNKIKVLNGKINNLREQSATILAQARGKMYEIMSS